MRPPSDGQRRTAKRPHAASARNRGGPREAAPGLAERQTAIAVIRRVLERGEPLDEALASAFARVPLSARDAAFARAIATAAIRHKGSLEAVLARFLQRAPAAPARAILLAGAAELLFLGVAPHATIDNANRLAAADRATQTLKGLVNAVLRRVAEQGPGLLKAMDPVALDLPGWLVARWRAAYGAETADAIARASLSEPPLDLALKDPAASAAWALRLEAEPLWPGLLRRTGGGRVPELPGYVDGAWWVQDAAAHLVTRLLGDVRGKRVIDLCAAPGGKTAALAAAGAAVTAVDISAQRLARLAENLARLTLAATVVAADARSWRPDAPADAVLLDAPCTATGTLRRRPDAAWTKSAADIAALVPVQAALIDNAIAMLKPGGILVYAVCSLEPEEGEAQAAAALVRHPGLRRLALDDVPALPEAVTPAGDLRTLPSMLAARGGLDGFFAARFIAG